MECEFHRMSCRRSSRSAELCPMNRRFLDRRPVGRIGPSPHRRRLDGFPVGPEVTARSFSGAKKRPVSTVAGLEAMILR